MSSSYGPVTYTYPDHTDWNVVSVLRDQASRRPDQVFLIEAEGRGRQYTFAQVRHEALAVANGLLSRGFSYGDRLAILLSNSPEYAFAWLGAAHAGVVEVPINNDFVGPLLRHVLTLTSPKGIVTDPRYADSFLDLDLDPDADVAFFVVAGRDGDVRETVARLREAGHRAESFSDLYNASRSMPSAEAHAPAMSDLTAILSTSGTTGPSKGVMMPNGHAHLFAEETVNLMRLTENDRYMLALPMFHVNAQFCILYPAMIVGASVAIYAKFSPSKFLDRVRQQNITVVNFVGVMMGWLWNQPVRETDHETTLRCVWSSPTVSDIAPGFIDRFGLETIVETYGLTETGMIFMTPFGRERPAGAIGQLVDEFFEAQIVDPNSDIPVEPGDVGELVVRPRIPWIMNTGYWQMPEATAEARRNLWYHTGDALRQDGDGWFYLVDRIKDAIRRRGENISSFEVEQLLLANPAISECAVIAVPSEHAGGEDEVKACIILVEQVQDQSELLAKLSNWAVETLPTFMAPRYWEIMETLPKTPSEKIRKAELRKAGITETTFDLEKVKTR